MNADFKYIVQCLFVVFIMIGFAPSVESWPPATDFVEADNYGVICDPDDENWAGTQTIETILKGDCVLSKDELSGHISCEQVSSSTIPSWRMDTRRRT